MDFASLSPRKKAFIVLGVFVVLLLVYAVIKFASGPSSDPSKKPSATKDLSVWVVGDETAWYSDLITEFKAKNAQYAATDIKFTKFGSYKDYEQTLLNVMADGNGPDIFVVNNNGGTLLENKMVAIPNSVINVDDFSKRFALVFDELLLSNKEKNDKGEEILARYLKGVPLGYETLGVFYNRRLVEKVPSTWGTLESDLQATSGSTMEFTPYGIGFGERYVQSAPDILTLLFLQNGVDSYKKITDQGGANALVTYHNFSTPESLNNLMLQKEQMDALGLTSIDMFVRGKIGALIGYPSLLREIELATKRAASETAINARFLKTAPVPQVFDLKDKKINLVNYSFFALSKYSKNIDAAQSFLAYLASPAAEQKYLKNFPYYLPAQTASNSDRLAQSLSTEYSNARYESFSLDDVSLASFDKGLKTSYDMYFGNTLTSASGSVGAKSLLDGASRYITCNVNHFLNSTGFDEECKY